MAGLYPLSTRAPGTIVTALIYNTDHQAHVDGRSAAFMQSHGVSVAQMNLTEDPFPGGVESLPVALSGELTRLRFAIAAIKTALNGGVGVNWYDPIPAPGFATIGARVVRASSVSVTSGFNTIIDFTGATADFNSGVWEGVVHPSRFTAPVPGKYFAACSVLWDAVASSGRRRAQIGVNGVTDQIKSDQPVSATPPIQQHQTVSGLFKLAASDYVEFSVFQDSGSTMHLLGDTSQSVAGALVFLGS